MLTAVSLSPPLRMERRSCYEHVETASLRNGCAPPAHECGTGTLDAALVPNSDAQVDDPRVFAFLQREIEQAGGSEQGRKHVVERYAYRWFNRIIAFRYMDVHGFTGTPVVSPAVLTSTNGLPEVLASAKRGEYDNRVFSLRGNDKAKERIEGLLSGSVMADDPQGLAYGLLLQSECRFWNRNLPFMFETSARKPAE